MSTRRLGDLVDLFRGRLPANTVSEPEGPRFFGLAEITARGQSAPRYVERDADIGAVSFLEEGDIVMALLGNIGDAALVDASAAGTVLGRECVALRVKAPNVVRPVWLSAWLTSEEFKSQMEKNTTGSTMPRLSTNALPNFTVTVPPIQKQAEIEGLVQRFDVAIATTATTLQQLQELRAAELQLAMATSDETP
jgi:type I restriction enzyme, S subunit